MKPQDLRAQRLDETEGFTLTRTIPGALTEPDGTTTDLLVMAHQVTH